MVRVDEYKMFLNISLNVVSLKLKVYSLYTGNVLKTLYTARLNQTLKLISFNTIYKLILEL